MPGTGGAPGAAVTLRAENARLRMLLEDKDAQIAALKTQNAELAERVARLERLISRNSGNSSMPPSTDDLPGKKPPERTARRGGGRKPGKQPGAPGAYLAWREHPDETEDVFPEGSCGCGADLAGAAGLGVRYSHQVTDLAEAQAQTTQYDRHQVRCARGRAHLADVPPRAGAPGMTAEHLKLFRRGVAVGLSQVRRVPGAKSKQPPARLLLECLRHREADVLRFLSDTAIPPTSNQAERDPRPSKTQQKISGRLRSEKTTRDRYAIRGYASTAAKHGIAVFTAIRDALAGNPWMPPIPASA
jgi:hypothetical protein